MAIVYLVEDDDAVLKALRFALEIEGLNVRPFQSAESLLAEVWSPTRGCLVIDQIMPAMSGLVLLKLLRSRGCNLPAILITTRVDHRMQRRAQRLGVEYILEKPLSDGALTQHVRQALANGAYAHSSASR